MILISRARGPQGRSRSARGERGFTLLEILIVIALIAIIAAIAIPSLGIGLKVNIESSTRELATVIRAAHDEALLRGQIYRIAFDIDKGQYWAEIGDRAFLMRSVEQEEEDRRKAERFRRKDEKGESSKNGAFSLAASITRKKMSLPTGVKFMDILTSRSKEPQKAGLAYAHVFPHGFIERLLIHVRDSLNREATLSVDPVSGKSSVVKRYAKEGEM